MNFAIKDLRETKESSADFELTIEEYEDTTVLDTTVLLFKFYNENELSLIGYKEDIGPDVLSIPSEIKGFPVTRIENNVFQYGNMSMVVLPNTIKYIGNSSFYYCVCLKEVVLPDSVIEIGHFAFYGCSYLTKVEIPHTVSFIGKGVFSDCYILSSIIVDPRNEHYDSRDNCNAIIHSVDNKLIAICKNTVIPQSVKTIEGAFCGKWFLKEYVVPNHIVEIGYDAFSYCENLERIIIPNSVKRIGKYAFYGCTKLQDIEFSGSIEEIEENAFAFCENLRHINLPLGLQTIAPHAFENCKLLKEVLIPESVTAIGNCAFYGTNIEDLFVPKSVVALGSNDNEEQLTSVFEGDNLMSIKVSPENKVYDSRNNCNAIIETASNSIIQGCNYTVIPDTVSRIAQYSFRDCKGINSLIIPNKVTTIERNAFDSCYGLEELFIPASVVEIAPLAFKRCCPYSIVVSPKNIVYDSRDNCNAIIETTTNRLLLANCKPTLPSTIAEIADGALNYSDIRSISIPDSVQMIDEKAFQDCSGLRQIIIKDPSVLEKCVINRDIVDIVSSEALECENNVSTESLESTIKRFETDLNTNADSDQDPKIIFSQKVIETICKNDSDNYKYTYSEFFNKMYVDIKNEVNYLNSEQAIKDVIFNVLRRNYNYFSYVSFVKYLNIYNMAEKSENECVEFYADFIHTLNGRIRLPKGKQLYSSNREDIDHGEIDATAEIIETLFHAGDALSNVFEYCHSCTSPIYSKMCYAIKYDANKMKYVYDNDLWTKLLYEPKRFSHRCNLYEGELNKLLDSLEHCYDDYNGVTNTICMIGCPWGNFSTENVFEKYVLRANIGIDYTKYSEKKDEIIVFLNHLQNFLTQITSELINEIKDCQLHQTAVVASIAQVMVRNMSHNIGSHVFSNLIGNDVYFKLSDRNILKNKAYVSICDTKIAYPKEQLQDIKSDTNNFQLSYFNQYLKNRMDYLSEVTFGVPNILTTKYIFGDVIKELDRVRILLNYISGIPDFKYTFCLKYNGVNMTEENDIAVAFPSDVLGNQAFYNIMENIIRNTAKHASNSNRDVNTFTIEFSDVEDYPGYYSVEIDNGIVEIDIDDLVDKQNERINASVLDNENNLRNHSLGLLEMEASAAFLRQVDIAKVDSYEFRFENTDKFTNKHGNLMLLKAINKDGTLGYRFFLQKPKEILFVGDYPLNPSKKDMMNKEGVQFKSEDDFNKAMHDGKAFSHPILLYSDELKDETKTLLSKDSDCKTLLPIRKVMLLRDEINEVVNNTNSSENVIQKLKDLAWKKYMQSIGVDNNDIYIGPVIGVDESSNCRQVVFANHGTKLKHDAYWSNRERLPELWVDNLSSYTQSKLPFFAQYSSGKNCTNKKPLNLYLKQIPPQLRLEIYEAYHNKVVVLDERIQRFAKERFEGSSDKDSGPIPVSDLFESTNVIIPKTKLDPEQFNDQTIQEIERFINEETNNASLLIHYGILERMYKTEQVITEKLETWAKKAKRVVVTSGRGSHSLQLPDSVCFANLSSVLNAFTENRNKYLINCLINQSRRKNE